MNQDELRVALAHDYLTQSGGAERVVASFVRAYPQAPLYTSVYAPASTFEDFRSANVLTTPLQRLPWVRRDPRVGFALMAPAWSHVRPGNVDVVLASSSGWAHGLHSTAPVVVYCHNPARWLYQRSDYLMDQAMPVKAALSLAAPSLKHWDRRAAGRAACYLANSNAVAARIRRFYRRDAEVLHPPVLVDTTAERTPVAGLEPGFLLTVSRGRGYKNTDAVIEAVEQHLPNERLVVVGQSAADSKPHPRISPVGRVSEAQLRWLYANARALVSVSHEDFGLTPLEANAFGTPVVLLRAGGFLETLDEGVSGVFVDTAQPQDIARAVLELPADLPTTGILAHAELFSEKAFHLRLGQILTHFAALG